MSRVIRIALCHLPHHTLSPPRRPHAATPPLLLRFIDVEDMPLLSVVDATRVEREHVRRQAFVWERRVVTARRRRYGSQSGI